MTSFISLFSEVVTNVHDESVFSPGSVLQMSGTKVPNVKWSQTRTHIILKVCLSDVKHFEVDVENGRALSFKSTDPADYEFKISTFAKIRSHPVTTPLGQYLLIKLEKMSRGKWDNITAAKSPRWLKVEVGDQSDSDSSEGNEPPPSISPPASKVKQEIRDLDAFQLPYDVPDDDSDSLSSNDEIEMMD
jgi:hypothetical protein